MKLCRFLSLLGFGALLGCTSFSLAACAGSQGTEAVGDEALTAEAGTPPTIPLLKTFGSTLVTPNGEQLGVFNGRANWRVQFQVTTGLGSADFIPHVVVTNAGTKQVVAEATGDVSGFVKFDTKLPSDGTYLVSIRSNDARIGKYFIHITADIPCGGHNGPNHAADPLCPAPLTCQVLKDPWSWSTAPGKKCLPQ